MQNGSGSRSDIRRMLAYVVALCVYQIGMLVTGGRFGIFAVVAILLDHRNDLPAVPSIQRKYHINRKCKSNSKIKKLKSVHKLSCTDLFSDVYYSKFSWIERMCDIWEHFS